MIPAGAQNKSLFEPIDGSRRTIETNEQMVVDANTKQ